MSVWVRVISDNPDPCNHRHDQDQCKFVDRVKLMMSLPRRAVVGIAMTAFVTVIAGATISREDVIRLVRVLRQQGLSLATVRGIKATLMSVLAEAVENGRTIGQPGARDEVALSRGDEPAHRSPIRSLGTRRSGC